MTFLQSGLFWALAPFLLAPVLIHLLSRRLSRPLRFSSVRHLKVSLTRSASIYRWRHWLFLLLRTLLLALILLAFLMPVLMKKGSAPKERKRTVFIVMDQSVSMQHQSGGKRALQRAKDEAGRILDTLRSEDRVNLFAVRRELTTAFPAPKAAISAARRFIAELGHGTGNANFSSANHQIGGMAGETGTGSTEIYYLSDFQRTNWDNVDFRPLPEEARVFFVDVGAEDRSNRALTDLKIDGDLVAGGMITVEVSAANFANQGREETIQILIDGRPTATADLYIAPNSIAKVSAPLTLQDEGIHLIQASIPHDALKEDDTINAVVDVSEKEEVLLLTGAADETDRGVDYLEAALNPFIGKAGTIRPRRQSIESVSPADFAAVTKVFISKIGAMEDDSAKWLADFIFSGGGVVWFLDGPSDAANLRLIGNLIGNEGAALQLGPWHTAETVAHARQVMTGDFGSPFLKLFTGTQLQDLGRLEVYDNYSAAATGAGKILLGFSDGSPAMTEQSHGIGQLVLINFSPNATHSNLAKQRFFPIWVQTLVNAFGTEQSKPLHMTTGQHARTNLWKNEISQRQFRGPDGKEVETRVEIIGQRADVSFPLKEAGIYQLTDGDALIAAFAVNPPPSEADLRSLDMKDLPSRQGTPQSSTLLEGTTTDFASTVFGSPVFHWFIAAALLCLVAELGLHLIVERYRPGVRKT